MPCRTAYAAISAAGDILRRMPLGPQLQHLALSAGQFMAQTSLKRSNAQKKVRPSKDGPRPKLTQTRPAAAVARAAKRRRISRKSYPIVGIGASAGGFEAFRELLQALPPDTGMAFVLVQHLDPGHESMLTKLLSRATTMPVREVKDGMRVEPNHVYVIPPNRMMEISGGIMLLTVRDEPVTKHLPIDYFLHSLAEDQGIRAIGVILSGTASDGTRGLKAIKAEGGARQV